MGLRLSLLVIAVVAGACSSPSGSPAEKSAEKAASAARHAGSASSQASPPTSPPASGAKPNIILVLTDDLDAATLKKFDRLMALAGEGMTFSENFVSLSLCCPSRSTILRGQYAHDTGVYGNKAPSGGFHKFHEKGNEESTIATWLKDAGYRTGLLGKYLNGFPAPLDGKYVPPGWTTFLTALHNGGYGQYDYDLAIDGKVEHHGSKPEDYLTDLLSARAKQFITDSAAAKQPFFLYVAPWSPHSPATPAPRYVDALPNETKAPRGPAFDEADVGDKPSWLKDMARLPDKELKYIDRLYHKRLVSMLAVQDLVGDIVKTLKDTGQLDHTYIFFTSDNGFHMGEHRLNPGKNTEFDTDLRVPLFVRGPGVPAGKTVNAITGNVDLAPTIAELAGAKAPDFVDGRSLAPFLRGETPSPWRRCLLLEHAGPEALDDDTADDKEWPDNDEPDDEATAQGDTTGKDSAEKKDKKRKKKKKHSEKGRESKVPVFVGLRTAQWSFVEYEHGAQELYDIVKDPDELENIAAKVDAGILAKLHTQAKALSECRGSGCRAAEEAP